MTIRHGCIGRIAETVGFSIIIFTVLFLNPNGFAVSGPDRFTGMALAETPDTSVLPHWPQDRSDLPADPAVVFGRLPNGFRYALLQNNEPANRVSMHLYINVGSLFESDEELGVAHFLEHMMFNGTTHFKPGELVKYFQGIGMQFGPDANAHTGFDETVYDILLPDGSSKSIDEGLQVLDDYARGALLLPAEIDRERKVVLAEMRTRDSASYRTFVASMKFEYPDMRISKRFPIGTAEVLEKADRSILKGFYDAWYRPERMVLVMVGDFNVEESEPLVKKHFADMASRAARRAKFNPDRLNHKGVNPFYHYEASAGQTTVTLETLTHQPWNGDSLEVQRKLVLKYMAHQIVQNRLNAMLNKDTTPFTSAWIGSGIFLQEIKISRFTAECHPDRWRDTLAHIEKTLRQARAFGFYPSELERVKRDYLSMLDNAVKAADTRDSSKIARQMIRQIGEETVFQSPQQEKEIFSPVIQEAALEEINQAFRDAWPDDHRLVLVTGNVQMADDVKSPERHIGSVYEKSRRMAVAKPEEMPIAAFPYLSIPQEKGKIVRRERVQNQGIEKVLFANGVQLNFKKTDFKTNQVLVNLLFGKGRSAEPEDKAGLASLSESVFNESGVGGLTRDELDAALAGKETSVNLRIREDGFLLSGETVTKELELLFQLLYAHLNDPAFRPEAFRFAMARFDQDFEALSKTVDGALRLSVYRYLAGGDSRFGLPPQEQFHELTLADVRRYLLPPLQTSPLELSIAGDFSEEEVISLAARYFGTLEAGRIEKPLTRSDTPSFPNGGSHRIDVPSQIPKALVVVAYPTADFWDIQRTRRMNVLADLFSEQLRVEIREKLGAAYSPFAYNRPGRAYAQYGVFQALVFVDPGQAEMVAAEVRNIAARLAAGGVSEEELARALEPTLTEIRDMRRTNEYWLNSVMTGSERHPEQLAWSRSILTDYAAITTDDVSRLAKEYLVDKNAAAVIIRPK